MEREAYVTDRATATAAYLAMALHKPLLIEGHPGVEPRIAMGIHIAEYDSI